MVIQDEHIAETRRQAAQIEIEATKSAVERNRLGQFATSNKLAIEIARYVESLIGDSNLCIRFGEPSVGSGSFFSAALTVFGGKRIERAVGIDVDPAFCAAARELWSAHGLEVVQKDFTEAFGDSLSDFAPNVVLANPPYVRHHHLSADFKARLQQATYAATGVWVNGLAGLYVYFLLLASAWMQDDGYAAWLIPSEFMDVNYGEALRKFLTGRVTLIRIHRFAPTDAQFGDALVSSAVVVFRKSSPSSDHRPVFTFGGAISAPLASEQISLERLRESRKWTTFPNCHKYQRRCSEHGRGPTLGDFFRIQRGIATGANGFFILDRTEAIRRGLPESYLKPILPNPRHLKVTVIESDSDGYPLLEKQLCVIDCDLPEHMVEVRYPELWEYLRLAESLGIRNGYLLRKRNPWYKQEQRDPAPFLCTYMGRGSDEIRPFRFIWNRSEAIATNLFLMMYPTGELRRVLKEDLLSGAAIHAALSEITGDELRDQGRVYGGGLHKIEPSELEKISADTLLRRFAALGHPVTHGQQGLLFIPP